MIRYIGDNYDSTNLSDRIALSRAKKSIINGRQFKYKLVNIITKEEYFIDTYAEASEITGVGVDAISIAFNKKRVFGKKSFKLFSNNSK